jgi:aminoglycoside/choline kinase family phosphotransferase
LTDWLRGIDGLADAKLQPASDDASFRRYFRVKSADASFIAMDAPPEREDCKPFISVAGYLEAMQLNAPRVLEANLDDGFLLLSDLGVVQYLEKMQQDATSAAGLYDDAMNALAMLQSRGAVYQSNLPPYNEELLSFELSLFRDWFCKHHLQIEFDESDAANW